MTAGPTLQDAPTVAEIPLQVVGSKLYADVLVGGKARRFVVDTGSPSMIDRAIVEELGLNVVGRNQGTDSHGVVIESEIVHVSIELGGLAIRNVPCFVANFSTSDVTTVFIGDGVLGSEVLRLGAWQFDLDESVLRFGKDLTDLPVAGRAEKLKLYDFGYPHAPIFDVRFARRAASKAMFDTGSPTFFAISAADLEGAQKATGVGRQISGFGSAGASLGGQAPVGDQLLVELRSLRIGDLRLGRVPAVRRDLSPSLIGARMLEHFVVTLDVGSGTGYFAEFRDAPFEQSTFGFTLAFDQGISVATVWQPSAAHARGLRAGTRIRTINGVPAEGSSAGIRRAMEAMGGREISITWDGGSATLENVPVFRR
ncbi:MAG: aspartyl protease family protein [Acidobacteriota bacterium]